MRGLPLLSVLFALSMSGCEGNEAGREVLSYVALLGGLALIALVGLLFLALMVVVLGTLSSALLIVNLRRPTSLTRVLAVGVGVTDFVLGLGLVCGTIWMGGAHVTP